MTLIATTALMEQASVAVARAQIPVAVPARNCSNAAARWRAVRPACASRLASDAAVDTTPFAIRPLSAAVATATFHAADAGTGANSSGKSYASASAWSAKHHQSRRLWKVPQ